MRCFNADPWNASRFSNFRSGERLVAFQRDVLPAFQFAPHVPCEKTRKVTAFGFPDWLTDAIADELLVDPDQADLVYFASGRKVDRARDAKHLRDLETEDAALIFTTINTVADQDLVHDYARSLHPRIFTEVIRPNLPRAREYVQAMPDGEAKLVTSSILTNFIDLQPMPLYRPVENSHRLYSVVAGLQQVKREVRKILLRGCIEVDAGALHLAIMAATWGVPALQALLTEQGASGFWKHLTRHASGRSLSEAEHKRWKSTLKHGVYALGYGGGEATIASQIRTHDEDRLFDNYQEAVVRLMRMPEMADLLEAKTRMLGQVCKQGGLHGAYGFIPLRKGGSDRKARDPLSVLAMASSSYEFRLMAALYRVAIEHQDYVTVLLYQFDGLTLRFRTSQERMRRGILDRMREAFDQVARRYGIPTQLDVDYL